MTPRTATGKALLSDLLGTEDYSTYPDDIIGDIAAIEAEAAAPSIALLERYEELTQRFHAAAYDDPDMQTREWERRLNLEWDELNKARSLLAASATSDEEGT